ncbi:MAG: tetratricopeptide repeat protein [Pseudomonadota bacterium]
MLHDICQTPVNLHTQDAMTDWNAMTLAFLSHGKTTPQHLGAVLAAEPGFAQGHAAKGLFSMMMGRAELVGVAREAALAARAALSSGDGADRDRLWTEALEAWIDGFPTHSIEKIEELLHRFPQDTLSAKVSHAIRFILGDNKGMRRSIEAVLAAHGPDHPCRGYLLGCHAFSLEETGDYHAAERAGLEGLTFAPDDAWGLHAVAHVYDMTGQPDRGIGLIESNCSAWDHCNNFRYHVWWHKALLHLDRGEIDTALQLYDTQIREDKSDDYRDIANATSLLVRLELEGLAVGDRWEELADLAENRIDDGCVVFADLHYMLALANAGRSKKQAALQARFAMDARRTGDMNKRVANPGVAALVGLNAFAEGRYDTAFRNLAAARATMQTIGGSHAQRDVFDRMTIDAGLRAGLADGAQAILEERIALRDGIEDRFAATRLADLAEMRRIPAQ